MRERTIEEICKRLGTTSHRVVAVSIMEDNSVRICRRHGDVTRYEWKQWPA